VTASASCSTTWREAWPSPRRRKLAAPAAAPSTIARSKLSPSNAVLTRLHVRYTRDSLGQDLVFRTAPPIEGGNGWRSGPDKHGAGSAQWGSNRFQGRYIVRHPWAGEITCTDPVFDRWGGATGVDAARDLAFAPRGGTSLSALVAEDVASLGLQGTPPPPPERRRRIPLAAYLRTGRAALALGLLAGTALLAALLRRARRPA